MNNTSAFEPLSEEELSQTSKFDADQVNDWVPIMPVPEDVSRNAPPHILGTPSKFWTYEDQLGRLLGVAVRFETPDGKKTLPLTYCEKGGVREWRWKAMNTPRPLYGLRHLAENSNASVLVVEGEKAADAAQLLFPEYAVTTPQWGLRPHIKRVGDI